ncbi:hypothetical protein FHS82_000918 [Pseudochelatococcus lubricantis]|uniref:Histidine kinase n=1 Tax=Pseudochelatococcus lubricantis TaxID=1538102 RepID=A0ABX0UVW4_9HYPH|nr:hypothetical protein [Pseudochelatococcus lubricantis]NIJ57092.1 hypothetical protein [Pseudochelatococcus lubricantis]
MTSEAFSLPPATEFARKAQEKREAERERLRQLHATGDAHRAEIVDSLLHADAINVDEVLRHTSTLIHAASEQGLNEVLVYRYPSETLMDHGRAIIANDPEWPETLRGQPLGLYNVWREHLKPLGYGMRVEILDYRNDLPGDVGSFLFWGSSEL